MVIIALPPHGRELFGVAGACSWGQAFNQFYRAAMKCAMLAVFELLYHRAVNVLISSTA